MSAQACTSARPARTAIAWATADAIYCEIPCKDGPPYITRYHKTAEGLAAALNVICERPSSETRQVARDHPKIKHAPKLAITEDERAKMREILRTLKII